MTAQASDPVDRRLVSLLSRRDFADLPHGCRCGARWAGTSTAHCGAQCHKIFSGPSTFDAHRRNGECLDPASVGMSLLAGRAYECWGFPGDPPAPPSTAA